MIQLACQLKSDEKRHCQEWICNFWLIRLNMSGQNRCEHSHSRSTTFMRRFRVNLWWHRIVNAWSWRTVWTEKCHTAVFTYVDVVLIDTPKHNIVAQVFKGSIGIWVGDGAHRRGWNRNQRTVKHNRFRSSTCGRVLKERNFGERQATFSPNIYP